MIDSCLAVFGHSHDSVHLLAGRAPAQPADRIPKLTSEQFAWLAEAVLLAAQAHLGHCSQMCTSLAAVAGQAPGDTPLPSIQRATAECCQAVAEAAAARWAKLLTARAHAVGGSSRLGELRGILDMTDVLASLAEAHGARSGPGLRTALQQLCKVSLESLHQQSISKMTSERPAAADLCVACMLVFLCTRPTLVAHLCTVPCL